jgi:hypothetical protein
MNRDAALVAVDQQQVAVDKPRCWTCGAQLSPSRTRPRETCSAACQKRRGFALRRINRRREWARGWQRWAMEGRVSHDEAAREIADITAIVELQSPLWVTQNH